MGRRLQFIFLYNSESRVCTSASRSKLPTANTSCLYFHFQAGCVYNSNPTAVSNACSTLLDSKNDSLVEMRFPVSTCHVTTPFLTRVPSAKGGEEQKEGGTWCRAPVPTVSLCLLGLTVTGISIWESQLWTQRGPSCNQPNLMDEKTEAYGG